VNLNLAPVLDTVPGPRAAEHNPPIGFFDREYGYTPRTVARHGVAFVRGMADGRVATAVKHFPGLGRVHANTDTSAGVTDRTTRRHDPYLAPFQAAIDAGAQFVMMSTARYSRLDPKRPAAFSPYVVSTMLRGDLGFRGVVISDDLAGAEQVARIPAGERAARFVAAGGDVVLTVDPATLPTMYRAVLHRARTNAKFRARVAASALRVLTAKQRQGLLVR
jgi:beta-N-acetylhexosaminidase